MVKQSVLNKLLDPVKDALTPEVASRLVALRADPETQQRLDELAEKANEGKLSKEEERDYDDMLAAIDLITVLQIKARSTLQKAPK